MNFDFPKDCEWCLSQSKTKGKTIFEFEIWEASKTASGSIAYFRRSTAKAMTVAIKGLISKMNKKK